MLTKVLRPLTMRGWARILTIAYEAELLHNLRYLPAQNTTDLKIKSKDQLRLGTVGSRKNSIYRIYLRLVDHV